MQWQRASRVDDPRQEDLAHIAASRGASVRLVDLEPYEPCRVVGVVEHLRIDPRKGYIDALISDGTGDLLLRWFIRSPASDLAVVPGQVVALDGMATRRDDGRLIIEEPAVEIVVWPEVA